MDEDRCVCCGEIIPEGLMVCPNCQVSQNKKPDEKQCNRFIVVHYVNGKPMTNHFENIDGANEFVGLLLSFTGIDAIELIGIVEEHHLLKKWGGKPWPTEKG